MTVFRNNPFNIQLLILAQNKCFKFVLAMSLATAVMQYVAPMCYQYHCLLYVHVGTTACMLSAPLYVVLTSDVLAVPLSVVVEYQRYC